MLVDFERVLLDLKTVLAAKKSHGGDSLLAEIARLEARHRCEEGLPEKALRLYGESLRDALLPAPSGSLEDPADGYNDRVGLAPASHRSKEMNHEQHDQQHEAAVAAR